MQVQLRDSAFDPWQESSAFQRERLSAGKYGATAVFIGTMRDFNGGDTVSSMTLEHYPEMTERYLRSTVEQAMTRWDIIDVLVVHRIGEIAPDETIVLVVVWSAHRAAAYEANRFIMEELKARAPFWKKEKTSSGSRWVEQVTAG